MLILCIICKALYKGKKQESLGMYVWWDRRGTPSCCFLPVSRMSEFHPMEQPAWVEEHNCFLPSVPMNVLVALGQRVVALTEWGSKAVCGRELASGSGWVTVTCNVSKHTKVVLLWLLCLVMYASHASSTSFPRLGGHWSNWHFRSFCILKGNVLLMLLVVPH